MIKNPGRKKEALMNDLNGWVCSPNPHAKYVTIKIQNRRCRRTVFTSGANFFRPVVISG
jgi:hypothetical protein